MTAERRLTPRASAIAFVVTTALATAGATGLFVLLDPRAQAFWATRIRDLLAVLRGFVGL